MKLINSQNAPDAIGPYSHAAVHGNTAYLSGQIALDPETMEIEAQSIEEQTKQVLENIRCVLGGIGIGLDHVVKTTVFLASMDEFSGMNMVYEKIFDGHKPARSTIEVARLPKDARVEIECIAVIKKQER